MSLEVLGRGGLFSEEHHCNTIWFGDNPAAKNVMWGFDSVDELKQRVLQQSNREEAQCLSDSMDERVRTDVKDLLDALAGLNRGAS